MRIPQGTNKRELGMRSKCFRAPGFQTHATRKETKDSMVSKTRVRNRPETNRPLFKQVGRATGREGPSFCWRTENYCSRPQISSSRKDRLQSVSIRRNDRLRNFSALLVVRINRATTGRTKTLISQDLPQLVSDRRRDPGRLAIVRKSTSTSSHSAQSAIF